MNKTLFLTCCGLVNIVGIIFVAVSFSLDYWLTYDINEDLLKTTTEIAEYNNAYKTQYPLLYHNRNRGLFRTCYDENKNFYDSITRNKVDDHCFAEEGYDVGDYRILNTPWKKKMGDNYNKRTNLIRAWFLLLATGLLMSLVSIFVGGISCWKLKSLLVKITALLTLVTALLIAGGVACFHGVRIMETEKITTPSEAIDEPEYFEAQLKNATTNFKHLYKIMEVKLGTCYFLCWIGCGFLFVASILYLICGFGMDPPKEKKPKSMKQAKRTRPKRQRQPRRKGKRDDEYAITKDRYHQRQHPYDNPEYGAQDYDYEGGYGEGYPYNGYRY
ncbi:DgyrCDS7091 [Dimorphilus gyrociliatus]|uniref:DgyrCDS7091 n=1 Tax=Dimorphilus gyrociliatus TaxID=2664684 RepID=A0A7I8VQP3_9ANNE|nr:DgyrCDS7091 [Dimorphilus gyrociliatus]